MAVRCVSSGNAWISGLFAALLMLAAVVPLAGQGAAQAMRLGGDERVDRSGRFDGVGRIECRTAPGRAIARDATAWVMGAADTVVTAAHTLFPAGAAIDPRACVFRLLNPDGSTREAARIRYVRSPWSDRRYRSDSAYDVAVLKLERPVRVAAIPAVAKAQGGLGAEPVRLVSLPGDAIDGRTRISAGEARPFPLGPAADRDGGMRVSDPSHLFASSVDSAEGSSGGLYYAPRTGAVIGLHVGYVCGGGAEGCFNFGLRFDAKLVGMIAAVAMDDSAAAGTELASADLPRGLR